MHTHTYKGRSYHYHSHPHDSVVGLGPLLVNPAHSQDITFNLFSRVISTCDWNILCIVSCPFPTEYCVVSFICRTNHSYS
jgi:hypothetical protein